MYYKIKYPTFFDPYLKGFSIRNRDGSDDDIRKWKNMSVEEYIKSEEERLDFKALIEFYKKRNENFNQKEKEIEKLRV